MRFCGSAFTPATGPSALHRNPAHFDCGEKGSNSDRCSPSVSWRVLNCHLEETTGEIRPKPPARRTVRNPLVGKELALWFLQEAPTDAITGCSQEVESAVSMLTCQLGWN